VLYLPNWPTDCLKRAEPGLAGPLALYERIKGGLRLAAVDAAAAGKGLFVGQNLADARAMVPGLVVREMDRPGLEARFADFADWHSNASPMVAVLPDMAAFGDLVLDVTGVVHLFGGEPDMLDSLVGRLEKRGFSVSGAIAPSIGAAWALSHFAGNLVVDASEAAERLDTLPVAALRLAPAQVAGLMQMGLKRIGQLRGRERKPLQARFGASLLTRLDQAYGLIAERMTPRLPVAEHFAERRFADPIGLIDDVLMCARDLAITLSLRLQQEALGAQTYHLLLYRVDHKVMRLSVNAARATRDAGHIARLFSNRAERLTAEYDPGFGIDMVRLAASSLSPLDAVQKEVFGESQEDDLDRLYDRMASRLGPLAVTRSKFVDTHIPERAVKLEPVIARTPDVPEAAPDPALVRPLRLLPAPEPIAVVAAVPDGPPGSMVWRRVQYRFIRMSGPERLGAEWWRSRKRLQLVPPPDAAELARMKKDGEKPPHLPQLQAFDAEAMTRDYYVTEDEGGRRFWLFRAGLFGGGVEPNWYLHGFFA